MCQTRRAPLTATPPGPTAAHTDADPLARHIEMAARNIAQGQRRDDAEVSIDLRLAAAAIIGGLRSCLTMVLADGSDIDEVTLAVEQAPAGPVTRR